MFFYLLFSTLSLPIASAQQTNLDNLAVARCRSQCITAVASADRRYLNDALCKQSMDCHICWDHCHNLAEDWDKWSSLCREEVEFCSSNAGCRHACRIMGNMVPISKQRSVTQLPQPHVEFRLNSKSVLLKWTRPARGLQNDIPVSWVFFREQDGPWRTLLQTLNDSLQFNVIRQPQYYSFCVALIDTNGPTAKTPVIKMKSDMTVEVLKQSNFELNALSHVQANNEEGLESEWRRLLGGVDLLTKRLQSISMLSNTSLAKSAEGSPTRKDATLPLILGIASTIVGLLIIALVGITCYFHRNQSQQLEDMRSSFHAWSSRLGASFRSSVHFARQSLKRRSARSSSTAVGSTDSGVVLTSSQIYAKTIAEV